MARKNKHSLADLKTHFRLPEEIQEDQEEGLRLFWQAMEGVRPLKPGGRAVSPRPETKSIVQTQHNLMRDFMEGKIEFVLSFTDEYFEGHVRNMDPLTMHKLRTGLLSPEAHLDLHGLNSMQAFETLRVFIRQCWYRGLRTVLIITGRGHNSLNGVSILREKVRLWLTQEPFKRVALAFCTAQSEDGGTGSLYVLLRQRKKKGRIYWERMPQDEDLYF